jgi:hypothetical protein
MEEDHNKEELPQLVAMDVSDDESISHSDDVDKLVDKLSEMHLCEHSLSPECTYVSTLWYGLSLSQQTPYHTPAGSLSCGAKSSQYTTIIRNLWANGCDELRQYPVGSRVFIGR